MDTTRLQSEVNRLMKKGLGSDAESLQARKKAQELLGLDDLNWSYFFYLYQGKMGGTKAKKLQMFEEGRPNTGELIAYPIATAPKELLPHLRSVEYMELASSAEQFDQAAKNVALWVKKMQAGSGSSMTRTTYLAKELGTEVDQIKIGAKGTDLFVEAPSKIPLAEAQLLQSIRLLERGEVGEVIFHDIVSSETEGSLKTLWAKPSMSDSKKSYAEWIKQAPGLSHFGNTYQAFIPTLDQQGDVTFGRLAPGGHALFAVDALRAALRPELRPKTTRPLVAAISNGEDLSSAPDRTMIGYVVKNRIPIVLVTTDRTAVDLKGGVISLLKDSEGSVSLTVIETAQAKEAGQEKLFATLQGAVSTNLTLFNYDVLVPLLTQEVREIGEDQLMRILSPDLISNVKEQKDSDGVVRKYLQLEGAMGSTIMNLDRYWRKKYGKPLVHLINVDRMHRTDFFSPIKSAFDYFMQFHSDRFAFDTELMRLKNHRPGELPQVSLKDPSTGDRFYQDVQNVLDCFEGVSLKGLDDLEIEGQIGLRGAVLRGRVKLINRTGRRVDLSQDPRFSQKNPVLENTTLELG